MINLTTKLAGYYKIESSKTSGGKRKLLADWFPNIITNIGLDKIATSGSWLSYCYVGTSSQAPAITDTTLISFLGHSTSYSGGNTTINSSPLYATSTREFKFNPGNATGNISEVGVGWSYSSPYYCFSRALILDGSGNPTTITVLSDEYLYVTYTLRKYMPETDDTGSFLIGSTTHNYTVRIAYSTSTTTWQIPYYYQQTDYHNRCDVYNGSIGAITGYPSGSYANKSPGSWAGYSSGNYYRDVTFTFDVADGNLSGGISALKISITGCDFQFGLSPVIDKNADNKLTLTFRYSWGRK